MLHLCNVLNVLDSGSTNEVRGRMREQDWRPTRDACMNQMPLVCNDATIRKSTLSQESPLPAVVCQSRASHQHSTNTCTRHKKH